MVKFFEIHVKFFFSVRQKVAPKVKFFGKLVRFFGPNFLATLLSREREASKRGAIQPKEANENELKGQ